MTKTSMKVTEKFNHVLQASYCKLQTIYRLQTPNFYNEGVYGWNCDLYIDQINDAIITTGYRNLRGAKIPDNLIKEYSARADAIYNEYRSGLVKYDVMHAKAAKNATDFIAAAIEATRYQ